MLKIEKNIQRFMISSPCYFIGEYDSDNLNIQSAQPLASQEKVKDNISTSPHSINYYIISFETPDSSITGYDNNLDFEYAKKIRILLSIFYGKKINGHGFIQWIGNFWAPDMSLLTFNKYYYMAAFNDLPRKDLRDKLATSHDDRNNWENFMLLKSLIDNINDGSDFNRFLYTAGGFYFHSLQTLDKEPEIAYLDLIMCGEILSNYPELKFTDFDLYDDVLLDTFKKISVLDEGNRLNNIIKDRLFSSRRRYTKTIMDFLNDYFFENDLNDTVSIGNTGNLYENRISKDTAEKNIKYSYDLRSRYVHSGMEFWRFIIPINTLVSEIQISRVDFDNFDTETANMIQNVPTYVGLERVMRFCLLRFIQKYGGVHIDDRLNDDA